MANSRINNAVRTHAATHLYKTVIVMEICCSLISFFVQYFFFFFQTCLKSKEILHRTEWQNQFKFMIKKKKYIMECHTSIIENLLDQHLIFVLVVY